MAAPYQHGSATVVLIDGYNVTGDLRVSKMDSKRKVHDATMYGATATGKQGGLYDGAVEVEGLLNNTVYAGSLTILDILQAAQTLCQGPFGTAVGSPALFANSLFKEDGPQEAKADALQATKLKYASNGRVFDGVFLHGHTAETTDHTTASVDAGAATTDGYNVQLQATAKTSSPSLAGVVQHSANNSTWATLATFATVTAVGTAPILSGSGTVNRYTRLAMTLSGGTITYAVALARHQL